MGYKNTAFVCIGSLFRLFFASLFFIGTSHCEIETRKFYKISSSKILPWHPDRLSKPWTGIHNSIRCAQKTDLHFGVSRGFLFNEKSGTCTPINWVVGRRKPGSRPIDPNEGQLYMDTTNPLSPCPKPFKLYEYGNKGSLACLWINQNKLNFDDAMQACVNKGAKYRSSNLMPVTTVKMLNMVTSISKEGLWVGLRNNKNKHVWYSEYLKKSFATNNLRDLWEKGEPNNKKNEQCIEILEKGGKFNDANCDNKRFSICQHTIPSP